MIQCKICSQNFSSDRSLHAHLKKHNITVAEYYTKFFPRFNLLTGEPMPFKSKDEYFRKDFSNPIELKQWLSQNKNKKEVKEYVITKLQERVKQKNLEFAPCHIDLELCGLPPLDVYRKLFGSYGKVCSALKIKPTYSKPFVKDFFKSDKVYSDIKIFIDTREQKPLTFKNSETLKLDFGDYTTGGDFYSYTYIDRKSEPDFKSTLSVGLERFKRELERTRQFKSFLFVLVESNIEEINQNNNTGPHKANMAYIWHNTRKIIREYSDCCQFIFSGNRKVSSYLVPRLLRFGKSLWDCDVQYYLDRKINS